ncbi:MAG: crotonase/enoyl-CoA hydratase family protein [Ectothiorhodospiraceae bacterium]|nr:crotonase/enoyl-CoA hydratase family protein [Ectothiorhodospiraceae bacterium]
MTEPTLDLTTDARGVATLTLSRPDKHNAMSAEMLTALGEALATLREDDAVRVVVLTGAGKSFCAGGDIDWMRAQAAADRATRIAEATRLANVLRDIDALPKPVIGRVNGQAFGGGVGMMAVCDTVIAADHARFAMTEVRLGIIPATISPYVLARLGVGRARRVFFSPRLFDAHEARDLGLVARVVPAAELDDAVEAEVAPYLQAAPGAVARAKALARSLGPVVDDTVIRRTVGLLADAWETPEAAEGFDAFFARRAPSWAPPA